VEHVGERKAKSLSRRGATSVMRKGWGAYHGIDADPGQTHESTLREVETDA
jgi:hypothetical protein